MSPVRTILVPVDFSAHSSKAFDFAVGLAQHSEEVLAGVLDFGEVRHPLRPDPPVAPLTASGI